MLEYVILTSVRALLFMRSCLVVVVNWLFMPFTWVKLWFLNRIASGHKQRHMTRLQNTLATTEDYQTWWLTAKRMDNECGYSAWSEDHRKVPFDAAELRQEIQTLQRCFERQDPHIMMHQLRAILQRHLRGVPHDDLFPYYCGTKKLLEQHMVQVVKSVESIYESQSLTLVDRIAFFRDSLRSYGRTALILSGGSALGLFHLGVMKALHDAEMLPRIICGTELGAALAALACTRREAQLKALFSLADVNMENYERVKRDRAVIKARLSMFFHEGSLVDVHNLKVLLQQNFGDVTFREAFETSQRVLNITLWHVPGAPVVFNRITTPDVVVWSAVCLSINANAKGIELLAKNRDGSLCPCQMPQQRWHRRGQAALPVVADTPTNPLSELFDVNFHIVSQAQAHVVPALLLRERCPAMYRTRPLMARIGAKFLLLGLQEAHHQLVQLTRWFPAWNNASLQSALAQSYEGDVTVVPVETVEDYLTVLHVPSKEHTEQCLVTGCRRAWPYVTIVMYHCLVERHLEKCLADLKVALRISDEAIRDPHTPTGGLPPAPGPFASEDEAPGRRPDGEEDARQEEASPMASPISAERGLD